MTFAGQNLGTAVTDRIIFVVVHLADESGGPPSITSVTIAGVSATAVVSAIDTTNDSPNNDPRTAIYWANVPTGTSGSIVVDPGNDANAGIGVYRATGIGTSITASDTATDQDDVVSMSIDVPDQGILLGGAGFEVTGAITTIGVTEDYEDSDASPVADIIVVGGSAGPLSQETNRTVSFNGSTGDAIGVAASFAAEGGGGAVRIIRLRGRVQIWGGTHFR